MRFFPAAIDSFDSDDVADEGSFLSTSTPSVGELDDLAIFERDFLVALGAPLTFATLCAKVGGRIQEERIFGNCSCKHHNWMLAGTESSFLAPWKSDDPFTNRFVFQLECDGLLYSVPVLLNRASGTLFLQGVHPCNDVTILPGLTLPVGDFVKARMEESLKRWDVMNPQEPRGLVVKMDEGLADVAVADVDDVATDSVAPAFTGMPSVGEKAWFCAMMDESSSDGEESS